MVQRMQPRPYRSPDIPNSALIKFHRLSFICVSLKSGCRLSNKNRCGLTNSTSASALNLAIAVSPQQTPTQARRKKRAKTGFPWETCMDSTGCGDGLDFLLCKPCLQTVCSLSAKFSRKDASFLIGWFTAGRGPVALTER